ncbi:molybdenum cofactor biosynthesis protein MoaE [Oerskovia paurometabola]|uniref:Molybdenum cofactor biosynthesis protein MoaE n=1 Tax=Oerskovia paurometabola TaxID=162170 RepID=A0ABW1XBG7_9CELL|nr:molybdenum cofactor biosynthesis protein MoaE [Oerskovia paurometabola]MBM7497191.1 molybdopterin synthase catalytic subunit [Oerskovia paurometabola]
MSAVPDVPAPVARVVLAGVGETALDVAAHERAVASVHAGAVVTFAGVVRDHDGGRSVAALTYEAHPDADRIIREIAARVAARSGEVRVAVTHRVGDLAIGDVALVAAVSSAHRAQAFAACGDLVEEVKASLPVWKRQAFTDGTHEWVGAL